MTGVITERDEGLRRFAPRKAGGWRPMMKKPSSVICQRIRKKAEKRLDNHFAIWLNTATHNLYTGGIASPKGGCDHVPAGITHRYSRPYGLVSLGGGYGRLFL